MGTEAALMMALTVMSLVLPLVFVKQYVLRALRRRQEPDTALRSAALGRLAIVCLASAAMVGTVLVLGPETVAPHMSVALR